MFCVIFSLGARGDDSHYIGILEPRGEGYVSGVQGGGSGGGEFEAKEGADFYHGRGQHR